MEMNLQSLSDSVFDPTYGRARMPGKAPREVLAEVEKIALLIFKQFNFTNLHLVFFDILKLFQGKYPGYRRCNTLYHDLNHTLECLLVTAQLTHGAHLHGVRFTKIDVELVLVAALMHDTGYLQTVVEDAGTGGKFTLCHISRSIDFMGNYFREKGFPAKYLSRCSNFLRCTGIDVKIADINFPSQQDEILGKILGTADLIGQMAGDDYLRKLPHLYAEFKEGCVPGFEDEIDLIKKTPAFWEMVQKRFAGELGQVDHYLRDHFRVCYGVDRDLHREAIERNMARLRRFLLYPSSPSERSGRPVSTAPEN